MLQPMIQQKNCLNCSKYFQCKDKAKSILYICPRYSSNSSSAQNMEKFVQDVVQSPELIVNDRPILGIDDPYGNKNGARNTLLKIIEENRIVSPDVRIPEGDFAKAPNFYTWCTSKKFLGIKPFVPQAMIGTMLFGDWCPDCSDSDYVKFEYAATDSLVKFEKKVCLLEHGKCPSCNKTRLNFYAKRKLNYYTELALVAGQRSGKSAVLGMLFTYLTHRQLKLERPVEVYRLLPSEVLHCTFVALTYAQAKDTLWGPFHGNMLDSPWFKEYHAMLDDVGARTGEEIYKLKDTFILYNHRRLFIYPAGPDKRVLRGRTRYGAAIDELGWFPNDASAANNVKMNAKEVYTALKNSLQTVRNAAKPIIKTGFYDVPPSYFMNISSPSSVRDMIMELYRESQHATHILGLKRATWEMNPVMRKKDLEQEFANDPIKLQRDFGADPPITNNPFISIEETVSQCFNKRPNPLALNYKIGKSKEGNPICTFAEIAKVKEGYNPSVLAIDAGYSNNSFAFAIGHRSEKNGWPVISLVGEVIPKPGLPINYSRLYSQILAPLIEARTVVVCAADRWNSLKLMSDMSNDHGVETVIYSLKYVDMQMFKSYMEDKQTLIPKPESESIKEILEYDQSAYPHCFKHRPVDHFVLQLLTVQDTGNGVIKGDNLTDDIARASMLCFKILTDEKYDEYLNAAVGQPVSEHTDIKQAVASKGYSGGGHSGSMGGGNKGMQSSIGFIRQRQ